jgi:hypothetical protein
MTFLEAAIEVLRDADGPLHFSEVAKRAVEGKLLSHVGRDPEAAMQSCLNSAVRKGHDGEEPLIVRDKPGVYGLRPGAALPDPPARQAAKTIEKPVKTAVSVAVPKASDEAPERKRRRRPKARGEAPAPVSVEVLPARKATHDKKRSKARGRPARVEAAPPVDDVDDVDDLEPDFDDEDDGAPEVKHVEFEAPSGSGLDGVTDVALVMANAMSRLVEERPELRDELEAMQQSIEAEIVPARPAERPGPGPRGAPRERERERVNNDRDRDRDRERERDRGSNDRDDDRGGRRRRRRRRRGKRVDWSGGANSRAAAATINDKLLDNVAQVLEDAGTRSLHVRQVAETLANKGVLGGEISEIERAVTAAILLDIRSVGRASRFAARGDARYQLQGTRLPEKAAKAEQALRGAARVVETETRAQLIQWLQSLGARALESLVRIHLQREGFTLVSALPPSRGLGKLVVEDPDPEFEEPRLLVLVVPRRTALEPKAWEGEVERNHCGGVVMFAMGEVDEALAGEARVIGAGELAQWLIDQKVGVDDLRIEVPVIDPTFIESIGGLDT